MAVGLLREPGCVVMTDSHHGHARSIGDFVSELIGTDVDAPELKAQLARMAAPTFEIICGDKSGITYLVEQSGVDERGVIEVLMALQSMPMPDAVADRLQQVGLERRDLGKIDIGVKRVAEALVSQHIGLLSHDGQRPCEPEASS